MTRPPLNSKKWPFRWNTHFQGPRVSIHSRFQQRFVEQYATDLWLGRALPSIRLPRPALDWGERLSVDGVPVHVDQIEYIPEKLRTSSVNRRAIAITWNPVIDEQLDDCPCLQLVQCTLRDGRLAMKVIFRSNDMLTATGANVSALSTPEVHRRAAWRAMRYLHPHLACPAHLLPPGHARYEPFCGKGEFIQPIQEIFRACGRCDRSKSA